MHLISLSLLAVVLSQDPLVPPEVGDLASPLGKVDYWQRFALTESSYDEYRRYRAELAAPAGGMAEVESTAWLVRGPIMPAGQTVRELRVRTNDAVGYDAICRP